MKLMTRAKAKSDAADGGGTSAIRRWIEGRGSSVKDTRKQAQRGLRHARKRADRQVTRARIAAAKARAQGRAKASGVSTKAAGAAGAAALVAGYFLDPDSGKRRRHFVRDRAGALIRRAEATKGETAPEKRAANDQALAERVKSEIFRPADAPKGSVNVNVENGVVYLRGEVEGTDQIRKLIKDAGEVDGVRSVENLLHTS